MTPPIRVLIVDDDDSVRRMLEMLLSMEDDIDVVGLAEDATAALTSAAATAPDVIVLDNRMPGRSGIEVLPDLLATGAVSVIMHTAHASAADQGTALRLGASVVEKGGNVDDLVVAIRGIA
jgi:DNA-binding NarL/FixJ family response regulator